VEKMPGKYKFTLFSFIVIAAACQNQDKHPYRSNDTSLKEKQEDNWYDSLTQEYIRNSDNHFIKLTRKDSSINLEVLQDETVVSDSAKYLVFHVGHTVRDEGGLNPRFITDQWLYIDSFTHKIYEYDIANDQLIEWNGN
jgi:hypothetical protein